MRVLGDSVLVTCLLFLLVWSDVAEGSRRRGRGRASAKLSSAAGNTTVAASDKNRKGKAFSLFNVVQFRNGPCSSTSVLLNGSGNRNGTCFTSTECSNNGGTAQGNCAAGFGVCCVFALAGTTGGTITQNCSYIQNPGFPTTTSTAGTFTYNIERCSNDVCSLRLDFESFMLTGTADTIETNGGVCTTDTFDVTVTTNQNIPQICGINNGQHMYVQIGAMSGDTAMISITLTGTNGNRQWDIKVTQVECTNESAPPGGCLQYFVGLSGRLETFNFAGNENHLAGQSYSACIRAEAGYCCVSYQVCADANSFTLDTRAATEVAKQDNFCDTRDYVGIEASSNECNLGANLAVSDRYCGSTLNSLTNLLTDSMICDCTQPFLVSIFTDNEADPNPNINAINTRLSRGVCLEWMQVPCS